MGLGAYRERCLLVALATALMAAAFIFGGYFVTKFIHKTLQDRLAENVIVDSFNATGYARWQNSDAPGSPPMYMRFHVFNITNPYEWLEGAKPVLVDIGPYAYVQHRQKLNVTFEENGTLARFYLWKYFTFDPANTVINPETGLPRDPCQDMVYSAYIAYAAVSATTGLDWYSQLLMSTFASHTKTTPFKLSSVQELLWAENCTNGVELDPLLSFVTTLKPLPQLSIAVQTNLSSPEAAIAVGVNVQHTGKDNHSLIHQYEVWNGNSTLNVWNSPEANVVTGTDGQSFAMGLSEDSVVVSWVDNIFRTANLLVNKTQNSGTATVHGVTCLWLVEDLADYAANPSYWGFGPSGVFNITSASSGAPVFVSKPHFLDADPYYASCVEGMQPNRSLHDENLFVEPMSGIAMMVQQRGQLNLYVTSSLLYPNMSTAYVPVSWLEQGGEITAALADQFTKQVYGALHVSSAVQWIGILGGFLLALCALAIVLAVLAPDRQPLPEEERLIIDYAVSSALLVNDVRLRVD